MVVDRGWPGVLRDLVAGRLSEILFQRDARPDRSLWVMDLEGVVQGRVDAEPGNWIWYRWTPAP